MAIIKGNQHWEGACVESTDLRAGAALILAGIYAQGETQIGKLEHIDRGYEKIHEKLKNLWSGCGKDFRCHKTPKSFFCLPS